MKKSIIYLCTCAVVGMMFATSCQDNFNLEAPNSGTRNVTINKDIFAVKGCINIKLSPGENYELASSSDGKVEMQSVPSAMASAMKFSRAYRMERVFKPAGKYEARTVATGLDRWYTVYFDESKDVGAVLQQFNKVKGVEYVERILPIAHPEVTVKSVRNIETTAKTTSAKGKFNDPLLPQQWHYYNDGSVSATAVPGADCNVKPVWEKYTTGTKNVIVAVVDGGIDVTHEDLVGNLYVNELEKNGKPNFDDDGNGFIDDVYGYNFVEGDNVVGGTIEPDDESHGTHVAGTIAARNNNGKGVAGIAGGDGTPGSGVRVMSCQIFRKKNEQGDAAAAIKYAADNGAVICQNSWGYPSASEVTEMPKLLQEAIDYFIKYAGCDETGKQRSDSPMKGGVVIFAAGNENKEFSAYPACYAPTVSVSAMAWDFKRASYSNYGKWVTIMAPGGDQETYGTEGGVLSTVSMAKNPKGYAFLQGTSMACPHVSGIAALVASYFGKQGFTNDDLKSRLVSAYRPFNIDEMNPMYKGKLGKGYIDAEAAFESDIKIAPDKVEKLNLIPDFVEIRAEWSVAKDEDKTASFYRLYISPNELTKENLKNKTYREINGIGHKLGETLKFNFDNLQDNKEYHIAIVAIDRWGNISEPIIKKCKTKLNHTPEATGFPEDVIELSNNERKTFSFNVADPDGHNWDLKTAGDTKGVSYTINKSTVNITIVPVLAAGNYTCKFIISDDLGAKLEKNLRFCIFKYMPPKLEKPFDNFIIGLDEGVVNIPLKGHYSGSANKELTYTVSASNNKIASAGISNNNIQIKALAKGTTRISVLASDGRQNSSEGSFQLRVVERKSAPVYAVYPIPVKRDINALLNPEVSQAEFIISSTVGERVMKANVKPDSKHVATLNLASLRSGTYKLTVHTNKGDFSKMFIKR